MLRNHFLAALNRALRRLDNLMVGVFFAALVILSLFQIVSRQTWIDPVLRLLTLWLGFIGAAIAADQGRHITIDVFATVRPSTDRMEEVSRAPGMAQERPAWLKSLRTVIALIATTVLIFLAWASVVFLADEMAADDHRRILSLPIWTMNLIFPYAFSVMALRFLLTAIGGSPPGPEPDAPALTTSRSTIGHT